MSINVPQTASSQLIDKINKLVAASYKPTALQLQSLKNDAKKLTQVDAPTSYVVRGMIAALEQDVAECRHSHENAIRLNNSSFTNGNYAVSLGKLGFFSEAIKYLTKDNEFSPGVPETLRKFVNYNIRCGRVQEAIKWMHQIKKEMPTEKIEYEEFLLELHAFMTKLNISDNSLETLLGYAIDVLHENNTYYFNNIRSFGNDGDYEWLEIKFNLDLPVKDVVNLANKLLNKLINTNRQDNLFNRVVLRYESILS